MEKLKKKDLIMLQKRRKELIFLLNKKDHIEATSRRMDGMPKGNGVSDPAGNLAAARADVYRELYVAYVEWSKETIKMYEWIQENVVEEHRTVVFDRIVSREAYRKIANKVKKSHFWVRDTVLKYVDFNAQ